MIECIGVTKQYGRARGVTDLTFSADYGEILGFLGPNGAGKTTTIKLLTGYFPPTAGTARVAGIDVERDPLAARRVIGYLPENAPVYPNMTVEGYVGFFLAMKRPEWRGRELTDRRRQRIAGLSKGLRQRAGLAQAIAGRPSVVILDEPTGGLDPSQVRSVRELVKRLAAEGATVMLSTHVLREVEALADKVVILNEGRIVTAGTLSELCRSVAPAQPDLPPSAGARSPLAATSALEQVFLDAIASSRVA
jgi:ABC-2 type transport system ATP-binding protein